MRINHNIQALNAYRNLSQTMGQTSKSLEKLSSGLRINRAADDAAGLAISEKMRSQIRGLDTAERNSLDAISLIQTGEGALNQTHEILQRMRELSVQAANGTLEDNDRKAIQNEIDQLTFEIDRIADTTQFNQKKLFSGDDQGTAFAEPSLDEVAYSGNGTWEGVVTAEPTKPAEMMIEFPIEVGQKLIADINGETISINGKTYQMDTTGATGGTLANGNIVVNLSSWTDGTTADDAEAKITHLMNQLSSAISSNDPDLNSGAFVKTFPLNSDGDNTNLEQNGQLTLVTANKMSPKEAATLPVTSTSLTDVNFMNPEDLSSATGEFFGKAEGASAKPLTLTFSEVPKSGEELQIDGLTIEFNSPGAAYTGGSAARIDVEGKDLFTVLGEIDSILTTAKNDSPSPVIALTSHNVVGNTLSLFTNKTDDGATNGLDVMIKDQDFEANKDKDLSVELQIGANSSETMNLTLGVMDAAKLGLARDADHTTILTTGVNAKAGVNLGTPDAARTAISVIDNAIRLVSEERSKLGAIQNRLEHTVTNLQTTNENLTSAESRIRDADMAQEMTQFTRNNILNQAGQAMLAQANQLPQGILQLLK
ncbi:flagellin N-terminal helical domain-containing protein [Bacillus sp. AK031]